MTAGRRTKNEKDDDTYVTKTKHVRFPVADLPSDRSVFSYTQTARLDKKDHLQQDGAGGGA